MFNTVFTNVYKLVSDNFNVPLYKGVDQKESSETIYHAILTLDDTTVKQYIKWIIANPGLELDAFATVCFEQVHRKNAQMLLIWKNDAGEYIFDINKRYGHDKNTALHIAALNNDELSVAYIISRPDSNLQITNKMGKTALDIATENVNKNLIELFGGTVPLNLEVYDLIRSGRFNNALKILKQNPSLSIDLTDKNVTNRTAFMLALEKSNVPHELIDILFDRGGDLGHVDIDGKGVFEHACYAGNEYALSILISNGININKQLSNGLSALDNACLGVFPDNLRVYFDERGAQHSLHSAIVMKKENITDGLIQRGVDINVLKNNTSPLELAWYNSDVHTMRQLLEAGADVNVVTSNGSSMINVSIMDNNPDIVRLLLDYGVDTSGGNRFAAAHEVVQYQFDIIQYMDREEKKNFMIIADMLGVTIDENLPE